MVQQQLIVDRARQLSDKVANQHEEWHYQKFPDYAAIPILKKEFVKVQLKHPIQIGEFQLFE